MTRTATTTTVAAGSLRRLDCFVYAGETVEVIAVAPIAVGYTTAAHSAMVEVTVTGQESGIVRYLDYGTTEEVTVVAGPSLAKPVVAVAPVAPVSATQRAREAVRLGKVRSLPASAALVLYALAAAQDEYEGGAPSTGSVATGAGLAISTTEGHLRSLVQKGLARREGLGWTL